MPRMGAGLQQKGFSLLTEHWLTGVPLPSPPPVRATTTLLLATSAAGRAAAVMATVRMVMRLENCILAVEELVVLKSKKVFGCLEG